LPAPPDGGVPPEEGAPPDDGERPPVPPSGSGARPGAVESEHAESSGNPDTMHKARRETNAEIDAGKVRIILNARVALASRRTN